jgi:hypothetical protein
METTEQQTAYIYKVSWYDTKRSKIPNTIVYYLTAEKTTWVFKTTDWFTDLVKVEYILVAKSHPVYLSAVANEIYN